MRISDWSSDVCSSDLDGEEVLVVNGEGLTFEQTIAIDDQYLFTVTQRVINNGGAAANVAPFGLISRSGTPGTLDFYILHEGPLGVFNGALEEFDYSGDLKDEYQGSEVVIERSTTDRKSTRLNSSH